MFKETVWRSLQCLRNFKLNTMMERQVNKAGLLEPCNIKKKSTNFTRINPCPIRNISMCALVEERLIQVGVSIHNVAQKRLEFGPYDLPISIRRSSSTPVQVSFTGLYPRPEILIPFLLGNFGQQFSDLFRNRETVKSVSPLMLINDSSLIHIQDYTVKLSIF